jgi:hypothetical protein
MAQEPIIISKLDAARRQLRTAITLWFAEGDPVSIHTLVHAAYEIIEIVSKQRNPGRRDLLFDSLLVKDEYRKEWRDFIRRPGNFFKHASKDGNDVIEFRPVSSELFILFAIFGVKLCGERINDEEDAYMHWLCFHKPHLLTEDGRKRFVDGVPVDHLQELRSVPKKEFLEVIKATRRQNELSSALRY